MPLITFSFICTPDKAQFLLGQKKKKMDPQAALKNAKATPTTIFTLSPVTDPALVPSREEPSCHGFCLSRVWLTSKKFRCQTQTPL